MTVIQVIGVGPGDPELLTLRARRLLEEAEWVAGFSTVLRVVEGIGRGRRVPLTYRDQDEKLAEISARHREGRRCAVCFMGDPSFSGRQLLERVEHACGDAVDVVSGVSSIQVAAARAGLGFEEVVFVTFHKRGEIEGDREFLARALLLGRGALVLPRPPDFMPGDIARDLVGRGVDPGRKAAVYESLSGNERTWEGALGEIPAGFSDLSILVIRP